MEGKKYWQKKEFIKEQAKWYKTLEDEGFQDIEYFHPKRGHDLHKPVMDKVKAGHTAKVMWKMQNNKLHEIQIEERIAFSLRNFLEHGKFRSPIHKLILKYSIEGLSYRKISKLLQTKFIDASERKINPIKRLTSLAPEKLIFSTVSRGV